MARLLGAVVLVVALTAAACSAIPTPPTEMRPITDADLGAMALRLTDLPEGYTPAGEELVPTDTLVRSVAGTEETGGSLETRRPEAGYRTAVNGPSAPRLRLPVRVQHDIERYGEPSGARERLCSFDPERDLGVTGSAVTELKAQPRLGEKARAFRMLVEDGETDRLFYVSVFRMGPIVSNLTTTGDTHRDDRGDHAYRLSRIVDERVGAELK